MRDVLQYLEDRYGEREKLSGFFNFAAQLPESLEYRIIEYSLQPQKIVAQRRKEFMALTPSIYRWLAKEHPIGLLEMGVSHTEIDTMRVSGRRPKGRNFERLDFTIDHMKSLFLGGNNRRKNFCLLSGKFNHFKNVLETLQINELETHTGNILTIYPRSINGQQVAVPYI